MEIVNAIADVTREDIQERINNPRAILSVTMDGSTDHMGDEYENIYMRSVMRGNIVDSFIDMSSPPSSTAEDLYRHMLHKLDSYFGNQSWRDRLLAGCFDGASNMQGHKSGLGVRLQHLLNWLIVIHCLAHRVELSIKDALKEDPYFKKIMTLLLGIYYIYRLSLTAIQDSGKPRRHLSYPSVRKPPTAMPSSSAGSIATVSTTFSEAAAVNVTSLPTTITSPIDNSRVRNTHNLLLGCDIK